MAKYRKKPVVIEAWQWDGVSTAPARPEWLRGHNVTADHSEQILKIATLEGVMTASVGDWVIRGVKGEIYPCKPDIFEATYEPAPGRADAMSTAKSLSERLHRAVELERARTMSQQTKTAELAERLPKIAAYVEAGNVYDGKLLALDLRAAAKRIELLEQYQVALSAPASGDVIEHIASMNHAHLLGHAQALEQVVRIINAKGMNVLADEIRDLCRASGGSPQSGQPSEIVGGQSDSGEFYWGKDGVVHQGARAPEQCDMNSSEFPGHACILPRGHEEPHHFVKYGMGRDKTEEWDFKHKPQPAAPDAEQYNPEMVERLQRLDAEKPKAVFATPEKMMAHLDADAAEREAGLREALRMGVQLAESGGHGEGDECPTCHFLRAARSVLREGNR